MQTFIFLMGEKKKKRNLHFIGLHQLTQLYKHATNYWLWFWFENMPHTARDITGDSCKCFIPNRNSLSLQSSFLSLPINCSYLHGVYQQRFTGTYNGLQTKTILFWNTREELKWKHGPFGVVNQKQTLLSTSNSENMKKGSTFKKT